MPLSDIKALSFVLILQRKCNERKSSLQTRCIFETQNINKCNTNVTKEKIRLNLNDIYA